MIRNIRPIGDSLVAWSLRRSVASAVVHGGLGTFRRFLGRRMRQYGRLLGEESESGDGLVASASTLSASAWAARLKASVAARFNSRGSPLP